MINSKGRGSYDKTSLQKKTKTHLKSEKIKQESKRKKKKKKREDLKGVDRSQRDDRG